MIFMSKITDVLGIIFGVVAIGGAVFAITLLLDVGSAISALEGSQIEGFDAAAIQPMLQFAKTMLLFGWAWSISVLLVSLYALSKAYRSIRGKK